MVDALLEDAKIEGLTADFAGEIVRPGDGGYESARKVWNGSIDRRPALIARCSSPEDVVAVVNFARENEILVSVRGGGHDIAGNAVCDDGIVIDLSLMKGIEVDPQLRTARAEGGVTWGELDRATQQYGLATPGGTMSDTGIAGLTLGGGFGWLTRKYGLSCDNLLSADIVKADGVARRVSTSEEPDLFWAIRGGGGNFGVVTSFEYRLHPVGPIVLAGPIAYPIERAVEIVSLYRDLMAEAPDELTANVFFLTLPALPLIPPAARGSAAVMVIACYAGAAEEGRAFVQPLKDAEPIFDLLMPMPYKTLQTLPDPAQPAGELHYWKSEYLQLRDEAIKAIVARVSTGRSERTTVEIGCLGGAMSREPEGGTAFGNRSAPYVIRVMSSWNDPADTDERVHWAREFHRALSVFSTGGIYGNFVDGDDAERVEATYGTSYDRLVSLKNKYDPTNFFRLNHNIKPTM